MSVTLNFQTFNNNTNNIYQKNIKVEMHFNRCILQSGFKLLLAKYFRSQY